MPSNWITVTSASPSIVIPSVAFGDYEIQVVAIDAFGNRSAPATARKTVDRSQSGATDNGGIEPVTDAAVASVGPLLAVLTWTPPQAGGLTLAIRHTPDSSGGAWGNANPITTDTPSAAGGEALVPALSGCYLLRFTNGEGAFSDVTAVAQFSAPFIGDTVAIFDESALGFPGEKINCIFDAARGGLGIGRVTWDNLPGMFDSLPLSIDSYGTEAKAGITFDRIAEDQNFDSLTENLDSYGVDTTTAYYVFSSGFDGGEVGTYELRRLIKSSVSSLYLTFDQRSGNIDEWLYWDDKAASDVVGSDVSVEFRQSAMALGSQTKWSKWAPLVSCAALARSFQFRCKIAIKDPNQNAIVSSLGVRVSRPAASGSGSNRAVESAYTTAALAQNEAADFAIELGKLSKLKAIQISEPSWVRFYRSSEQRASNLQTSPGGSLQAKIDLKDSKPYGEVVTSQAAETLIPNPVCTLLGDSAGLVYVRLVKQSPGTGPVTMITTSVSLEI